MTARPVAVALITALAATALAACGGSGGSSEVASAPTNADEPATGTLRVFTYEDTVAPDLMKPFEKQNPDLEVKTASFGSDSEAAAKLAGGFQADVVESCLDEMTPLTARNLLRPIDTAGVPEWDNLAFTEAPGVRSDGQVWVVPLSAGPQGLIVNTEKVANPPDSWQALFDPQYEGEVAIEGDTALLPIAETALAMGMEDPMNLSAEQIEEVQSYLSEHRSQFRSFTESDSDAINLLKSGEVVISDGGRGTALAAKEAGVPVEWIAPKEGPLSWICGLGIPAGSKNVDAAYRMINYYTSPEAQAQSAREAYVVTNPEALPLVPAKFEETADPASVENAIAEREPPNYDEYVHAWQEVQSG